MANLRLRVARILVSCLRVFFFFQAEDGIRDYKVTGVQTCALPICTWASDLKGRKIRVNAVSPGPIDTAGLRRLQQANSDQLNEYFSGTVPLGRTRSEERRVGKECRSRWSPYH